MRLLAIAAAAFSLVLGLTATATGAPPEISKFYFDDPAVEAGEAAFVSAICGFPVAVDLAGKVVIHVFDGRRTIEIDNYNIRGLYSNPANGKSWKLVDAGPDVTYIRDGKVFVAVTGRSLTGTGVIGHVVFDLTTGEAVFVAGNDRGFYADTLCAALE